MSRQHVEIIDGKEYTVTTLPGSRGSLPHWPSWGAGVRAARL